MSKPWDRAVILKSIEVHRRGLERQQQRLAELEQYEAQQMERWLSKQPKRVACANETCGREFLQTRRDRIYCSRRCTNTACVRNARQRKLDE